MLMSLLLLLRFWCAKSYCANHTREKTYSLPCGETHGRIVSFSQSVSQPVSSITSMKMERQKTETIETDFVARARARLLTHSFGTSTLSLGKCLFTAFLSYAVILGVCLLFIVSYIVKAHINRAFLAQALLFDFVESRMNTHTQRSVCRNRHCTYSLDSFNSTEFVLHFFVHWNMLFQI